MPMWHLGVGRGERWANPSKERNMEFIDQEAIDRFVRALREDLNVLQIKVGALETLLLNNDEIRAKYTKLVSEQSEALMREQGNKTQ
jgi:hypothetical protein